MAASFLLDTNIVIAALKGEPRALLNRLSTLAPTRLHLSAIVLGELLTGAQKSHDPASRLAAIQTLTRGMQALAFDADAAQAYGTLRAALERQGQSIGPMDLLIAAQAIGADLVLVTDNLREFKRVPGLRCENWLRAAKAVG